MNETKDTTTCWNDGHHCGNRPMWRVVARGGMGMRFSCDDHLLDTMKTLSGSSPQLIVTWRVR